MSLSLGIDLGTSGCRGVAIDAGGKLIAEASLSLPASNQDAPGQSEQQPDAWWQAVQQILSQLADACSQEEISAIAVDGTSSTLLLCDQAGEPLTPGLMYDDSRGRSTLTEIASIAVGGAGDDGQLIR